MGLSTVTVLQPTSLVWQDKGCLSVCPAYSAQKASHRFSISSVLLEWGMVWLHTVSANETSRGLKRVCS